MSEFSNTTGWVVVRVLTSIVVVCGLRLTFVPIHAADKPAAGSPTADFDKLSPEEAVSPKEDVIRLFDGKSLGDCYTWLKDTKREDPRKVFRVEDGVLHISGDGLGGLVTNKRYRDYHLVLEFKWGERTWHDREDNARDSGLLIHSNGRDGGYGGIWMPAIEVQIIEGGVGDFVPVPGPDENGQPVPIAYTCQVGRDRDGEVIWDEKGPRETFKRPDLKRVNWYGRDPAWDDKRGFRGPADVDSPLGEWTRIDVMCDGGHIETFVNGKKVNEAFDASPREGRIQLQSELAEIYYRRWELWPLGKGPAPGPAKQN
jgi:hypothetical protein